MSKQAEVDNDRIPSYEESIASSPSPATTTSSRKTSPRQTIEQRTRHERIRRIAALISNHLEVAISNNFEDGIAHFLIIILPTDAFPSSTSTTLSTASITSPPLPLPTTLLNLHSSLHPTETANDYRSSFLIQYPVVHDLTHTLQQSLNPDSSSTNPFPHQPPPPPSATDPSTAAPLPSRPTQKSWLSRNLSKLSTNSPPPDHDPTGSTGVWNLGWRSESEDLSSTQASISNDDLSITTKLQDVTFRTESDMGLWESRSVRGIWVEMEFKR